MTRKTKGGAAIPVVLLDANGNPVDVGGSAIWGDITGTLSNQADLQTDLDARVSKLGDTSTGTQVIEVSTVSDSALVLKTLDDNTTNNLIEILDSLDVEMLFFTADGKLGIGTSDLSDWVGSSNIKVEGSNNNSFGFNDFSTDFAWATITVDSLIGLCGLVNSNAGYIAYGSVSGVADIEFRVDNIALLGLDENGSTLIKHNQGSNPTHNSQLEVVSKTATTITQILQAASAHSVNVTEWRNSSGAVMSSISSGGEYQPPSLADAAASTNSIYYSTDSAKLVYKDSGGVVNALY